MADHPNDLPHRAALDVTTIRRDLTGSGRLLRSIEVVESTGSTNADLLARHRAGEEVVGTVLIAEQQTAGRGRHGRSWVTPPRSQIALSLGVDAGSQPPAAWGWLPLLTGVAVVDAVKATTGIEPQLKWPNDIEVGGEKLGGILAEVATPDAVIVLGLGLNVTLTPQEAPDTRATSLLMQGSTMLDRTALLGSVLAELTARIDLWKARGRLGQSGPDQALLADYRRRSATLGARVRAELPGNREITGTATDIDSLGQLIIETDDGSTTAVSAGDITHLHPGGI